MFNKNDIANYEKQIVDAIAAEGTDEAPGIENMINGFTGPGTGLIYKPGKDGVAGHLEIANGYAPDEQGNILNIEKATGPNGGGILRDGVIVRV